MIRAAVLRLRLAIAFSLAVTLQPAIHGQAAATPGENALEQKAPSVPSEERAASAESPGAIYKEAMHPLDVVRSSMENWSEAELGGLAAGMHRAQEACKQRKPSDVRGDDVFDLARLCSFGQDWNEANTAALAYIASGAEKHKAEAYALSVYALVHLNAVDIAVQTAEEMMRKLPFDAEVAYTLRDLKIHLEQTGNAAALTLARDEHPAIVHAIQAGAPLAAAQREGTFGIGLLYESGMELAFFERYAGNGRDAATVLAELERALPLVTSLPAEDRQRIDAVNTQFELLGKPLPGFEAKRSYFSRTARAQIGRSFGAATVLVVFPDWCVQCRKMMSTMTMFATVNTATPIHAYGLMFPDHADSLGQAAGQTAEQAHAEEFKELQGTATLLVSPEIVRSVGATDYPLGIVVDRSGIVRFAGILPVDAFNGDGYIEKVILRMVATETEKKAGASR